jgi:DNA-binding NarL/FixJ family response regulator
MLVIDAQMSEKTLRHSERTDQEFTVVCVDDNPQVADAVRVKLLRAGDFKWVGWAADADAMLALFEDGTACPDLIILDLDMPGIDPFEATARLSAMCLSCRVVVFTGHVRKELIERAVEAGAWGYVAKSDGADALVDALRCVMHNEFTLSPEARSTYDR